MITTASQFLEAMRRTDRLAGLIALARQIRIDRHASGMPLQGRVEAARLARDDLRQSIRSLCHARDALAADDIATFELFREKARLSFSHALAKMRGVTLAALSQGQRTRAQRPRTTVRADGRGLRKSDLVESALRAAGVGAATPAVWDQLIGVLEQHGMHAVESGAKDQRKLTATDDNGKQVLFSFKGVQTMLRDIREPGTKAKRGRPTK